MTTYQLSIKCYVVPNTSCYNHLFKPVKCITDYQLLLNVEHYQILAVDRR